jgi:hypothetical protein
MASPVQLRPQGPVHQSPLQERPARHVFPGCYRLCDVSGDPQQPKAIKVQLSPRSASVREWLRSDVCMGREEAFARLASKIRYIDYNCFRAGLVASITSIGKIINPALRTVIGVVPGKSNEWVTKIAMKHFKMFSYFPCLNIDHKAASNLQQSMKTTIDLKKYEVLPQQIFLFDDGSYSGKQMVNHVTSIVDVLRHKAKNTTIFVVVPYMTSHAMERLSLIDTGDNIKLVIAPHEVMETVKESLDPADYQRIGQVYPELTDEDPGITATFFQHKRPNSESLFQAVTPLLPDIETPYGLVKAEEGKNG